MFGEKSHAKPGAEIFVLAKEYQFSGIELFSGFSMLEYLVYLTPHEGVLAGNGAIGKPIVGIGLGEANVVGDDAVGDGLKFEETAILSEVSQVEGVLVANAVGIPKETMVETVEKILVLGHALVDDVFLGEDGRRDYDDNFALETRLGLAPKKGSQDGNFTEYGYAVHGFLGILGDEATDYEWGVVGDSGVGLDLAYGERWSDGKNDIVLPLDLLILTRDTGGNGGIYLEGNLGSVLVYTRPDGELDARRDVTKIHGAHIILDELRVGYGDFLRDVYVGHAVVESEHARSRKNLGGAFLDEGLQTNVELAKSVVWLNSQFLQSRYPGKFSSRKPLLAEAMAA